MSQPSYPPQPQDGPVPAGSAVSGPAPSGYAAQQGDPTQRPYPGGQPYPDPGGQPYPGGDPLRGPYATPPARPSSKGVLIGVLGVVLAMVVGVGIWSFLRSDPQTRLAMPATLAGKVKTSTGDGVDTTVDDDLKKISPAATESMSAEYGYTSGGDGYLVGGINGKIEDPAKAIDTYVAEFGGYDASTAAGLKKLVKINAGPLGGEARCGTVVTERSSGSRTTEVCIWANNTVFGLMTAGHTANLARDFVKLRAEVEKVI